MFTLSTVISMSPAMAPPRVMFASLALAWPSGGGSTPFGPLAGALGLLGVALFGVAQRPRRRKAIIGAAIAVLLATGIAACGGNSSIVVPPASQQTVLAVNSAAGKLAVANLPLTLGTIRLK
jgi:hypothetical protein